jgi:exodeoxyribonuclease V alpha subunit
MSEISGSVTRITFYNQENGYTVLRIKPTTLVPEEATRSDGLITAVGYLPSIGEGEHIKMGGKWTNHLTHGLQFEIATIEQTIPQTIEGLEKYLSSGLIHGVGPKIAKSIIDTFGLDSLNIIENHAEKLMLVPDIGRKRAQLIQASWQKQRQLKDVLIFLHGHGISTNLSLKIYQQYQNDSVKILNENPYQLVHDIKGIRFITADKIAKSLGLDPQHPTRIEAAIIFVLEDQSNHGHSYYPHAQLVSQASELIALSKETVEAGIDRLSVTEDVFVQIIDDNKVVYLRNYYFSELGIATKIHQLISAIPSYLADIPPALSEVSSELSDEQKKAILSALSQPVSIISGGPGTGKTTALRSLIQIARDAKKKIILVSPTGRAAKRLSEATDFPASTIHRLLGYSPHQGFAHNKENPLAVDLIVIDEVSMLDIVLANQLLRAIPNGAHVVLVGDVDQLPSVGAGDFLRDMINSKVVSVNLLTQIFRQEAGSEIIINSHLINQGKMPKFSSENRDFFKFPAETGTQAADWVIDLINNRIPKKFGYQPDQIQVIVPMYKGEAGIHALNLKLQQSINPASIEKGEIEFMGKIYRQGDKVMQTKNNYDKQVFNGDVGKIIYISKKDKELIVLFGKKKIDYIFDELDQILLAYAITVHKSQGAEFPVTIIVLIKEHYLMLQRNLLYTAVTRAKNLCILISNSQALQIAIRNDKISYRYSGLKHFLIKHTILKK